jgi:hypothetical protein
VNAGRFALLSGRGSVSEFFAELVFGPEFHACVVGFIQLTQHVVIASQSLQVQGHERDHPLGWLFAREGIEQQAADHRRVNLDLDALDLGAQQMPAAQDLFEEAEEHFDHPAVFIQKRNDVRRHIQQIGDDPQHAVTGRAGLAHTVSFALATLLMGRAADADQAGGMIRSLVGLFGQADFDDLVADHAGIDRRLIRIFDLISGGMVTGACYRGYVP